MEVDNNVVTLHILVHTKLEIPENERRRRRRRNKGRDNDVEVLGKAVEGREHSLQEPIMINLV